MKHVFLMATLFFISTTSWAMDQSNASSLDILRGMLFDPSSAVKTIVEKGKTASGENCLLTMTSYPNEVYLRLELPQRKSVSFIASVSNNVSADFTITEYDEGLLDITQIAYPGKSSVRESLHIDTEEQPGETTINNVVDIEIKNQSKSETDISCSFN